MKRFALLLSLFPIYVSAQLNESDSLQFKANLSLTLLLQSGNVNTFIFRAKSDMSIRPWQKWAYKTQNSFLYQEFGKNKADNNIISNHYFYYNPEYKIYPVALVFFSSNFRREIDLRSIVGAGATYQILMKPNNWLKFSISAIYEHTNFGSSRFNFSEYNGRTSINTWRANFWMNGKHHLLKDKLIFSHVSFIQPSLEQAITLDGKRI